MTGKRIYMDKFNELGTVISEVNDNYDITYRVKPDSSNIIYRLERNDLRSPYLFQDYRRQFRLLWEES